MEKDKTSRHRHDLRVLKGASYWGVQGYASWKNLKSWPLRVHFQHSGPKIRVFKQNMDIIKFWLFLGVIFKEK